MPNRIALQNQEQLCEEKFSVCSPFWMTTFLANSLHGTVGL